MAGRSRKERSCGRGVWSALGKPSWELVASCRGKRSWELVAKDEWWSTWSWVVVLAARGSDGGSDRGSSWQAVEGSDRGSLWQAVGGQDEWWSKWSWVVVLAARGESRGKSSREFVGSDRRRCCEMQSRSRRWCEQQRVRKVHTGCQVFSAKGKYVRTSPRRAPGKEKDERKTFCRRFR